MKAKAQIVKQLCKDRELLEEQIAKLVIELFTETYGVKEGDKVSFSQYGDKPQNGIIRTISVDYEIGEVHKVYGDVLKNDGTPHARNGFTLWSQEDWKTIKKVS